MRLTVITAISLSLLTGCATNQYYSEDELYQRAQEAVEAENYETAEIELDSLAENFPFGRYAQQVELQLMYVELQQNKPQSALLRAQRFIRLQPDHPALDYVYFVRALSQFEMAAGNRGGWSNAASKRDLEPVREAYDGFARLIEQYPDSDYNNDARTYMAAARSIMAEHQLNTASYYARKGAWAAALSNAQAVLQDYPGTRHTQAAKEIAIEAYRELGSPDLAAELAAS
ncbi:outer membrane protein assembly factor BamD [Salinibius halmophilus]|uniref:outer membrane protein assembly factor BamD n=1 Tax=Salinibius halmophilus TaxID=1853216 RepID=UPI00131451C3|nr:outer membrane protein assembly factor BamD [Salinibius halmophilus]